jgi:hypothetical protein
MIGKFGMGESNDYEKRGGSETPVVGCWTDKKLDYNPKEPLERCSSYIRTDKGDLEQCNNSGRERKDNGLAAGVHCDGCWDKMLSECRQRSW